MRSVYTDRFILRTWLMGMLKYKYKIRKIPAGQDSRMKTQGRISV
jgi:hypothetical protein